MDANQKTLSSIPLALFYPGVLALSAAAGYFGGMVGKGLPVDRSTKPMAQYAVAAVVASAALYAGYQAKLKRDGAAIIDLYNYLVELDDPSELGPDDVKRIGGKYGVDMHKEQLDGLQKVYGQYLEVIIPTGDQQLKGDEGPKIKAFKETLGLSDEDAAPVHIEVGRRLSRQQFEYKDRQAQFEQRKAFQRLIYISQIVFGDQKAAFLLPWRRVFNLNESQLVVARRDNAKAIFSQHMAANGGDLPAERTALRELRDYQVSIKLFDESAEELVRASARKHVETHLEKAVEAARGQGSKKDPATVVAELKTILDYGRKLSKYANDEDLIPGLGMPTLHGGPWDVENKKRDVREVFKVYVEEGVAREGAFTPQLDADMKDLAFLLCLGAKEAADIRGEVSAALYKKLLREEVTSKRIDAATSPAEVLGKLVGDSGFSPEAAADLHKQLYRQKLNQLVSKKKLTSGDQEELKRIRRILCISTDVASQVMKNTAGRILEEVVADIFLMGAKPVSDYELDRVESTIKDLQLDRGIATDIVADLAKQRFKAYVQQAQKERDRKAAAQTLKKLVQFNSLVVTPILEKAKGTEAAKKEIAELLAKAAEEAKKEGVEAPEVAAAAADADKPKEAEDPVKSVQKMIAANRGEFGEEERKGQKEINLGDFLDKPLRAELYKNYLMYSMSGDVVELPVGGVIRKKTNLAARQTEMVRLQQLGDLLGMTQVEVAAVHNDLAEQAYRSQAQDVLRGTGQLTAERKEYLDQMRQQLGLQQAAADKIIKEVRTEVLGAAAALEEGERWDLEKVVQMHKEGVDITKALEEGQRRMIFRKAVDKKLNDGKAEFDAAFLLGELPKIMGLEEKRVRMLLKELVGARKRMLLVQAVSQFRQKRPGDSVTSLSNLLSAYRAQPEDGLGVIQWGEREELKELYQVYCAKVADEAKRAELAGLFGLTAEEQQEVRAGAEKAAETLKQQQQEEEFFFL